MDTELANVNVGEELPMANLASKLIKVVESTKWVSTSEQIIHEAWHGWEESLRAAYRQWRIGEVAL